MSETNQVAITTNLEAMVDLSSSSLPPPHEYLDLQVESLKEQINAFCKENDPVMLIKENLTRAQRKLIYEYTEGLNLFSSSIMVDNTLNKHIAISKELLEMGTDFYTIDAFVKYSMIPIPVPMPEHIEYYINLFEPYYGAKQFYKSFMKSFSKYRNISSYTSFINGLMSTIVADIKNSEKTKEFMSLKSGEHISRQNFGEKDISFMKKRGTVYVENNDSKQFLSVDIKSANFNILKDYDRDIVLGFDTWTDLIKSYTDDEFVVKSKHFREVVFGKVGITSKALNMCPYYLSNIIHILFTDYNYEMTDVVSVNCDEIVLKYKGEIPTKILEIYPGFYNVEVYDLHKFQNKPFYYKNVTYPETKTVLKCVPKKFVAQAIKNLEGRPIDTRDMKFMDEGMVAQYDKPYFF